MKTEFHGEGVRNLMKRIVSFLNRGKEENIEFSHDNTYGFSISLGNYCGDSSHVSNLSLEDMINIKQAIDELISQA